MQWLSLFLWMAWLVSGNGALPLSSVAAAAAAPQRDAYRQFVQLTARRQYPEALAFWREWYARGLVHDGVYDRLVQTALAVEQLAALEAEWQAALQQTPADPKLHYGLGLIYAERGALAQASAAQRQCLSVLPEFPLPVIALFNVLKLDAATKRNVEAEALIQQLLQKPANPNAFLAQALYATQQEDFTAAENYINQARALGLDPGHAYYQKAFIFFRAGRYAVAASVLDEALANLTAVPDEEQQKNLYTLAVMSYVRTQSDAQALPLLERGAALAQALGDERFQAIYLGFLAGIQAQQGAYAAAIASYQQALVLTQSSPLPDDQRNAGRYLLQLGRCFYALGDYTQAGLYYEKSLPYAVQVGDKRQEALNYFYRGNLLSAQERLTEAQTAYQAAIERLGAQPPASAQALAYATLSHLYLKTGALPQARRAIQEALNIGRRAPVAEIEMGALANLGELHWREADYQQAQAAFTELLAVAQRTGSVPYTWLGWAGLGDAARGLGQLEAARRAYQKAIEAIESLRGRLELPDDKANFLQDKIEVYKKLLGVLTKLATETRQPAYLVEAFQVAESARARALADWLTEAKVKVENELTAAERATRRQLQQQLTDTHERLLKEQWRLERKATTGSAKDDAELVRLTAALQRSEAELVNWWRTHKPRYAALQYPQPLDLAATQARLDARTLLLAYTVGEEASYLFAVSCDGYEVVRLPAAATLAAQVTELRTALTRAGSPSRKLAAELSDVLIGSVSARLRAGKTQLLIVPDGALQRLPFEVLRAPLTEGQARDGQPRYLIEDWAVSYAPSLTVLAHLPVVAATTRNKQKDFIAFADPQYTLQPQSADNPLLAAMLRTSGAQLRAPKLRQGTRKASPAESAAWPFSPLPQSRREVTRIASLFPAQAGNLFLGVQATEENVKTTDLSRYRFVHFSVHGLLNEANPRFSSLVLSLPTGKPQPARTAQPAPEDGLLSAYEIFELRLNAELVTLSACETGLGKEMKGEGLLSLVRAFLYAGTPSVLASLWKVDETGTADLMIDFYRNLREHDGAAQPLSKAEALRQAKLKAIRQGSAPFFWAPFVLIGRSE